MAWNCRGLGGHSIIFQLKESKRLYLSDIGFISETKQNNEFIGAVSRRLRVKNRWEVVESMCRSGGMLIFWGENVLVHQIIKLEFCIETEIEGDGFERRVWVIFIYASTDVNMRKAQWETLKEKRNT